MRNKILLLLVGVLLGSVAIHYFDGHGARTQTLVQLVGDAELALERPVPEVWLDKVPLEQALEKISRLAKVPIDVDRKSLEAVNVNWQTPITLRCRNRALGDVLDEVLQDAQIPGMTFRIVPGRDSVSISGGPRGFPVYARSYAVGDLIGAAPPPAAGSTTTNADELMYFLNHTLSSGGFITDYDDGNRLELFGGRLIVFSSWRGQRLVRQNLQQLREIPPYPSPAPGPAPEVHVWNESYQQWVSTDSDRGAAALGKIMANFRLDAVPFGKVFDVLHEQSGIPFFVDRAALKVVEVSLDAPVTVDLHDVTVSAAIEMVLHCHPSGGEIDFAPDGGTVCISSRHEIEKLATVRVYDMRDWPDAPLSVLPFWSHPNQLPRNPPATNKRDEAFEQLIRTILETVDPQGWRADNDSVGLIQNIHDELVIQQTYRNHEKIAALLNAIRAGNASRIPATQPASSAALLAPRTHRSGVFAEAQAPACRFD